MAGIKQFIEKYGAYSFDEMPFCDGDAVTFARVIYMPFELTVSESFDDEPRSFADASRDLFDLRGNKHSKLGLMITKAPSQNMISMADHRRYADIKIYAVKEVYSAEPAIQYCSGTFILPDGTLVIAFRGTNDFIAGWKEDIDIFTHKGTPSYDLALDYINNVASRYDGKIIICGHSKGGNIALYTALKCSDEIRSRIVGLYNCDGPGYHDYGVFHLGTYDDILPVYNHYVPSSSLVGMMMAHDYDYKAVKSSRILGAFQHDLGTWQIKDGKLVELGDVNILAKVSDLLIARVCENISDEEAEALDYIITAVLNGLGQIDLTGVVKNVASSAKGALKAFSEIQPEIRELARESLSGKGSAIIDTIKSFRSLNISDVTRKAYSFLAEI